MSERFVFTMPNDQERVGIADDTGQPGTSFLDGQGHFSLVIGLFIKYIWSNHHMLGGVHTVLDGKTWFPPISADATVVTFIQKCLF